MELYLFFWKTLAWSITVAGFPPLTIPWGVLAYKIWHGSKPIDEELSDELWSRSWRVSLTMLGIAALFMGLDFATVDWFGVPEGAVHIVYFFGCLALASGLMMFFFSMEDFFQGLSLAVLYLFIPAAVLWVLWWLIGWNPLYSYVLSWLSEPKR
jgi:hypothetical protein